jgi:hypothetical protein
MLGSVIHSPVGASPSAPAGLSHQWRKGRSCRAEDDEPNARPLGSIKAGAFGLRPSCLASPSSGHILGKQLSQAS